MQINVVSLPARQLVEATALHNQSILCSTDARSLIQSYFSNNTDHNYASSGRFGTEVSQMHIATSHHSTSRTLLFELYLKLAGM